MPSKIASAVKWQIEFQKTEVSGYLINVYLLTSHPEHPYTTQLLGIPQAICVYYWNNVKMPKIAWIWTSSSEDKQETKLCAMISQDTYS